LTFGKIAEQVQDMFAVLAGDNDVPGAVFRLNMHGETTFYRKELARLENRIAGSVFQVQVWTPSSPTTP
jgi:hypothetical protein